MYYKLTAVMLILFVITGCASKVEVHPNELVKQTHLLKPSPLREDALYYINKKFDVHSYNHIQVPKIKLLTDDVKRELIDKKTLTMTTIYFRNALYNKLNHVIKDHQKQHDLILEVAIVSLDVSYDDLAFYNYLPYSLALKAIKRGTGIEGKKLRVHLALKLIDAKSKETLAMVVDKNVDKEVKSLEELRFSDIKPILDSWVSLYTLRLQEFKEGKYNNYKVNR